ncbi:MAG: H-X9-DG-CTERM domain-containing protein, partial [Patescibacteria group bacterium]|nr:H-X9-DG-CTERM domain-containing protein [Patescibacteria group bacterium]
FAGGLGARRPKQHHRGRGPLVGEKVPVFQGLCGDWPAGFEAGSEVHFPTGPLDPTWSKFGSPEGQQAQFVFLDGHVRSISYSISNSVFERLCLAASGLPLGGDEF